MPMPPTAPTARKKLIFDFPDEAAAHFFLAWYLDAGGDQSLYEMCEMHGKLPMSAEPPAGRKTWDWGDPKLASGDWTIEMVTSGADEADE